MAEAHDDVIELVRLLRDALDGSGPAVLAEPAGPEDEVLPEVPDDVAVVVGTSGSTGRPRRVMLTADALRASAEATAERLGGHGRWLLALPTTHVAGLQVVLRAALAGSDVTAIAPGPFRPETFVEAVQRMDAAAPLGGSKLLRLTSLVPTQLHRLLEGAGTPGGEAAVEALRSFDAVLVGGAALHPDLRARAEAAGVRVVMTYGMSETCGGCVYDGVPLRGVRVRTDPTGRVLLSGRVLARGYLGVDDADSPFIDIHGGRWLRTEDLGELELSEDTMQITLTVLGRADDVVVTGGEKVSASAVEAVLSGWGGLDEVAVVGTPDDQWGQVVVAVATTSGDVLSLDDLRAHVRDALGAAAAPRVLRVVDALPLRGPGKPDRAELARLAAEAWAAAAGPDAPVSN
ncbi:O-succinylbenzoic acid--CoA ligase [Flavimobilis soli]|uniref:O-succinylbenzoic acid--CoA ligase n=1 Tax=Flavimobilis soli TaxID=442709 RepID=A0A2A9ECH6_9MICO|nr:O-succinylbenzoic acid--CoA ligase [Flavimobilis soli]